MDTSPADAWNRAARPGTRVRYRPDLEADAYMLTTTSGPARSTRAGLAVVPLTGMQRPVPLANVSAETDPLPPFRICAGG